MGSKISDTANRIALHLNIRAQHLANEWFKSAKLDD